ncbi:hypothetical protein BJ875DRAFT_515401 [Amylocarpus encephaloides]|uniref:Uncharacterized protein n=1 Tax=Amylocarpus encephaloides TaxID=45428 RepID=A0A9P8C8S5_9HELO|nr:hypothetical protein BJ875DRAFT_515401 [Amylocarpus encephaloides]
MARTTVNSNSIETKEVEVVVVEEEEEEEEEEKEGRPKQAETARWTEEKEKGERRGVVRRSEEKVRRGEERRGEVRRGAEEREREEGQRLCIALHRFALHPAPEAAPPPPPPARGRDEVGNRSLLGRCEEGRTRLSRLSPARCSTTRNLRKTVYALAWSEGIVWLSFLEALREGCVVLWRWIERVARMGHHPSPMRRIRSSTSPSQDSRVETQASRLKSARLENLVACDDAIACSPRLLLSSQGARGWGKGRDSGGVRSTVLRPRSARAPDSLSIIVHTDCLDKYGLDKYGLDKYGLYKYCLYKVTAHGPSKSQESTPRQISEPPNPTVQEHPSLTGACVNLTSYGNGLLVWVIRLWQKPALLLNARDELVCLLHMAIPPSIEKGCTTAVVESRVAQR